MDIFFSILYKILPLYIFVIIGFIGGRFLDIDAKGIGKLIIYVIAPFVIFEAITHSSLSLSTFILPLIAFLLCSFIAFIFYKYGKLIYGDARANVLAIVSAEGNTGYFGIPIALLLFNQSIFGIYILGTLGVTIFENTVVYYLTARGRYTVSESLGRLKKLPAIYAFIFAILFLYFDLKLPNSLDNFVSNMQGAYVVLGMMLIGFGISKINNFSFDYKFIALSFLGKFILWPISMMILILLDQYFFHIYDKQIYKAFILLSIVPIAANTVIFATVLNVHPEKVSSAVLFSTIFGLIYVPIIIVYLFK
jgi:predicted permease